MDDDTRYSILSTKKINIVDDAQSVNYADDIKTIESLPAKAKSKVEKIIKPLAEKLGILSRSLKSPAVEIEFKFSKNKGLKESLSKQLRYGGDYGDFAKALTNLDQILENAVLIEKHGDKYKGTRREDHRLESVSVLFGACRDGNSIIPVQMEIKKSSTIEGQLYVTVAMTKMEADVLGSALDTSQGRSLISASEYSLPELFQKINPADKHFLKYLPDGFLSEEQIQAKHTALQEDAKRIETYKIEPTSKKEFGASASVADSLGPSVAKSTPNSEASIPQAALEVNGDLPKDSDAKAAQLLKGILPANQSADSSQQMQAQPGTGGERLVNQVAATTFGTENKAVENPVDPGYNKHRSEQAQNVMDRLNQGNVDAPGIDEIMAIPEIADAERANEGTETFNLPNREPIRENGYRQAMQKGSWSGTDYSGEVRQGYRMDIVIGLPGSGKSSVYTERLSQEHKSRVIDTDDFREYIPEYNGHNVALVHEEASIIRNDVFDAALENGDNILLSTIGANAESLAAKIAKYREDGYEVYLHLNELPNSKSLARAIGRYVSEDGSLGRYVSPKLIAAYGDKPTQTYLYLTGQGGTQNGKLVGDLRTSRSQGNGDAGKTGATPQSQAGAGSPAGLLSGYDWYNNDVERGEAPRLIQSSEASNIQTTPEVNGDLPKDSGAKAAQLLKGILPADQPADSSQQVRQSLMDGMQDIGRQAPPLPVNGQEVEPANRWGIEETLGLNHPQTEVDAGAASEYNKSELRQSPGQAAGDGIMIPGAAVGDPGVTYTASNKPVQFRYAVVPAEALITSNDQYGNANAAYPMELQPRDRTRAASQTQINSISRNLNPALLAESPTAQNGAPIIRSDGVVIGGNGRVSAINQAYSKGRGTEYQQYITQRAAQLGIDPATLPQNPVLVRVATGVDNYTDLASALNASTTANYSATEAAQADAAKIGNIVEYLSVSDDGSIRNADNSDFIQKFVTNVVPETERGDVIQANGQLSQAGERRIQNALFAYAYGDTDLVERLTEKTDSNIKNITGSMLKVAGRVANLQSAIDSGEVQDLGVRSAITNAVNLYLDAKGSQQSVANAAGQMVVDVNGIESQYDGLTVHIAKALEVFSRSGKQIQMFLTHLVDSNMLALSEDAGQTSFFGAGENITQEGLYDQTIQSFEEAGGRADKLQPKSDFSQYREYKPQAVLEGMAPAGAEGASSTAKADGRYNGSISEGLPGGQPGLNSLIGAEGGTSRMLWPAQRGESSPTLTERGTDGNGDLLYGNVPIEFMEHGTVGAAEQNFTGAVDEATGEAKIRDIDK